MNRVFKEHRQGEQGQEQMAKDANHRAPYIVPWS